MVLVFDYCLWCFFAKLFSGYLRLVFDVYLRDNSRCLLFVVMLVCCVSLRFLFVMLVLMIVCGVNFRLLFVVFLCDRFFGLVCGLVFHGLLVVFICGPRHGYIAAKTGGGVCLGVRLLPVLPSLPSCSPAFGRARGPAPHPAQRRKS